MPAAPRRKIPAPFQRPSITVGGYAVKREWRWVTPDKISVGDIVPSVGKVVEVLYGNDPAGWIIRGGMGESLNTQRYASVEQIWAFTKAAYQD